jgi:subtilisin family serine protease
MRQGSKTRAIIIGMAIVPMIASAPLAAKSPAIQQSDSGKSTYIVILDQPSLAQWHRERVDSPAFSPESISARGKAPSTRLNAKSADSQSYLRLLDEGFEAFRGDAVLALGRELKEQHRYRAALNGFSASMTAEEASRLSSLPQVKSVEPNRKHKLHTDAGPAWLKADDIWNGVGSIPARAGEGVVIGVIDTGINWDHISFSDPGGNAGSHDFVNPYGSELGLCSEAEVECNDKLVGVYDFVVDNPETEYIEENTMGEDNSGHGSHVASIAAGNLLQLTNGGIPFTISGVARHSNIVSYRVCYVGDPDDPETKGCDSDEINAAIDQAVSDGVDVINYSAGVPDPTINPWTGSTSTAFLNAFGAGIFIATSAGNEGPAGSSMGYPANAPWISAIGSATHNRLFGAKLENMIGGDTTPPADMFGATQTGTSGLRDIVHAKDFGNALCGTGPAESGPACDDNTGASSPFAPGTFNGEIVVCDRGTYGRIEKGKNLQLAGAGGMILANTEEDGESLRSDEHCLPAIHIGNQGGNNLRFWLTRGIGHLGSISAFDRILDNSLGDQVNSFSSRGPNLAPVDVMKPNVIAPGSRILGAYLDGNGFAFLSGTSQSSPAVAGSAALLLSVNSAWTPSIIASALETTALPDRAINFNGSDATPHDRGAGLPQLDLAARAALALNETQSNFTASNPDSGGEPRDLNLPSMMDANCQQSCSFTRTVTDLAGGRSWTASASGFPAGSSAAVSPTSFTLSSGGSRALTIDVDVSGGAVVGKWVYGNITLSSAGLPDAVLPVVVFATGGELPSEFNIFTEENAGSQIFPFSGLAQMLQANFTTGGLVRPQMDSQFLVEDPSPSNPYDGGAGVFTILHEVPDGALWFHAETTVSTSHDVDLYVGRDANEDGIAGSDEEICSSTTPDDLELCDILNPEPGSYWIVVQNWSGSPENSNDEVHLQSAVIGPNRDFPFVATGPGIIPGGTGFDVRLSWQKLNVLPGEELLGAVGFGTSRNTPNNVGIVPVYFNRTGIAEPKTFPLFEGTDQQLALAGLSEHNRMFIDVPAGATSLVVEASGEDASQSNSLVIDLHRVAFDSAFGEAPFASEAPGGTPDASASGSAGNGPKLMVAGGELQAGRYYAVLRNTNPTASSVTIQADVSFSQVNVPVKGNMLISVNRGGISQGIDYQPSGPTHAMLWYTYTENHSPVWYLAAGGAIVGDIWNADLLRFSNDGETQTFRRVGRVSMTELAEGDSIFSWTLFGESGSERMGILTGADTNPCPTINGEETSISGIWGKAQDGLGGASVIFIEAAHGEIHYIYSDTGLPIWLQAAGASGDGIVMTQFSGDCPTCATSGVSTEDVGLLGYGFSSASAGEWSFDFLLKPPLSGDVDRDDAIVKLTDVRACD